MSRYGSGPLADPVLLVLDDFDRLSKLEACR